MAQRTKRQEQGLLLQNLLPCYQKPLSWAVKNSHTQKILFNKVVTQYLYSHF